MALLLGLASGATASQIEGQVHQALLGDVLGQMGYEVTLNPVGVPDIVAKLQEPMSVGDVLSRVWLGRLSRDHGDKFRRCC